MSRITCLFLLCLATGYYQLNAQTIINKYAAVLEHRYCDNIIRIDTAAGFNAGDTVLMIQMKGAVIDTSNTASFGTILDYRGAGNYEYNVIEAKNGNDLTLLYTITRDYNIPDGKVQLVRVPSYQNYSINQLHTCMPWNGTKGGVFAIHVAQALTLNENIDVSGKGFRGATNNQNPTQTGPLICSNTNYFMAPNFDSGSMKGEGIVEISLSKSYGRGKLGNGGGGGNTFNAGGGGGSNGSAGGMGGSEYRGCNNIAANNATGGTGGFPLAYTNTMNKIFMGGGGGSAQANNFTISTGGNGGGICIITAGLINGNFKDIKVNGTHALECTYNSSASGSCHDGMGGGGAGGTLLLNTDTVTSLIYVSLKGGKGGNESGSSVYQEVGPGGGGSGGILWSKPATNLSNLSTSNSGGLNGTVLYNGSAWGAQPGQAGQTLTDLAFNFPTDSFAYRRIIADFSDSIMSCHTRRLIDERATITFGLASWIWLFPNHDTATQQYPAYTFPGYGTYPVTLIVGGTNGCMDSITKNISIPYIHFANAGKDTSVCPGDSVLLQASGGISYAWSPPEGLNNPDSALTRATVMQTTTYIVTVTNALGCVDQDTVSIVTTAMQPVAIVADDTAINCNHRSARLTASGSASYQWEPGMYCDDSNSPSPRVNPPATTLFTVTATSIDGCISRDTITIVVYSDNQAGIFIPNIFSPNNDGLNDDIGPVSLCGFTLEQFAVFNHWGQRIFTGYGPGTRWDGTCNAKAADISTYYYYVRGKKDDGTAASFKGSFTLMR